MTIFRTSRLLAREARGEDSAFFLKLLNEPAWHQFIAEHSVDSLQKAKDYIEERILPSYRNMGFGLWVVERLDDATPIGICGLLKRESLNSVDLGFAFLSDYWGKGFASEAARGSLEYAERHIRASKIYAITDPRNDRSITLLKKLGFFYEGEFSHPGSDAVLGLYAKR